MLELFYNRDGSPIGLEEWCRRTVDREYLRIDQTTLPDGKWVSTVWQGLNHRFGEGPPLIFETMVFTSQEEMETIDQQRYATENEAILGHQEMVAKYLEG